MTLPALVFRLYRLLMVIGERRLQDHRLRLVAAEAFKVTRAPHPTFAPAAEAELGLRSIPFDLGAAPGSDVLGTLTASVRALTEAL